MFKALRSISYMTRKNDSPQQYYDHLEMDIVPALKGKNNARWMNVGYWKDARNYNDACRDMAEIVSRTAEFKPGDVALDVGCGCGEQDFYWASVNNGIQVTAIDISPKHIETANRRKDETGEKRLRFTVGDASDMPFEDESFSKVCALDCAYHFDTREEFFKEAFRLLKSGGVLVVTDMLPKSRKSIDWLWQKTGRKSLFIPESNMYGIEEYEKLLVKIGFSVVESRHIGDYVFTGLAKYFLKRYLHPFTPIYDVTIKAGEKSFTRKLYPEIWGFCFGTPDYVIVKAVKR
ncbi:MAG: methyltransferase domain-containing protein [Clostridiales bacterium]|jgi:microcystin synthetase protein McyJ|nr:methyltransferase domain-containing protein [Clostridiales bacterium]